MPAVAASSPGDEPDQRRQQDVDACLEKLWFNHSKATGRMTRLDAPERMPDWLMGGQVRRRVFEALARPRGCKAAALAEEIGASEATVYEVIRALKQIGAVEKLERGRYRLAHEQRVAQALRSLVVAAREFADTPVSRPPGRVKRQ